MIKTIKYNIFMTVVVLLFLSTIGVATSAVRSVGSDTRAMGTTEDKSCWQQGFRMINCPGGACSSCYDNSNKKTYYKKMECNTTGYVSSCPDGQILDPSTKLACNTSYSSKCICDTSVYKYTTDNCSNELGGETCTIGGKTYYKTCDCDAAYSKTCEAGIEVPTSASDSCGGKYKSCACITPNVPAGKTCTNKVVNGTTCYYNCVNTAPKTCADGGFLSSKPSGQTCTSVTYEGLTCYKNCAQFCEAKGLATTRPYGKICLEVDFPGYSQTCYATDECRAITCQDLALGNNSGVTSIPKGTNCTKYSVDNLTCYKDCKSTVDCTSAGYKSTEKYEEKCDTITYNGGTCYTNCKKRTCDEVTPSHFTNEPSGKYCNANVLHGNLNMTCPFNCTVKKCEQVKHLFDVPSNMILIYEDSNYKWSNAGASPNWQGWNYTNFMYGGVRCYYKYSGT